MFGNGAEVREGRMRPVVVRQRLRRGNRKGGAGVRRAPKLGRAASSFRTDTSGGWSACTWKLPVSGVTRKSGGLYTVMVVREI